MARVWPVYEGYPNTVREEPWTELPLDDAIRVLGLQPEQFVADLTRPPRFGETKGNLTWLGYRHTVVEVGEEEAKGEWRPGFYKSPLLPQEAFYKLLEWRIEEQLDHNWHVTLEKGTDADGDPAIWAWMMLRKGAPANVWTSGNRERIETDVRRVISESGVSDWVFVRFRTEEGERAVS
jgi:hypothetical protein